MASISRFPPSTAPATHVSSCSPPPRHTRRAASAVSRCAWLSQVAMQRDRTWSWPSAKPQAPSSKPCPQPWPPKAGPQPKPRTASTRWCIASCKTARRRFATDSPRTKPKSYQRLSSKNLIWSHPTRSKAPSTRCLQAWPDKASEPASSAARISCARFIAFSRRAPAGPTDQPPHRGRRFRQDPPRHRVPAPLRCPLPRRHLLGERRLQRVRSPEWWRLALSVSLFALACVLSWTAARALGRHLRIDASVDSTHELVRSGPYRLVRHPIYTSRLCVLLGTGVLISPLYLLLPAVLIFLIGTEIRMQVEDRMLVSRFGEQFTAYQHNVSRLIPFLKCPDGQPRPAASGAMARPDGPTNPEPENLLGTLAFSLRTLRA